MGYLWKHRPVANCILYKTCPEACQAVLTSGVMKKGAATPSFRPLYEQTKILLTQSLVAGEWKPGEAIPSEIDLAARFRVSQGTVRKAIDEQAGENILVRHQGKGTFVASHNEPAYQYRFLR